MICLTEVLERSLNLTRSCDCDSSLNLGGTAQHLSSQFLVSQGAVGVGVGIPADLGACTTGEAGPVLRYLLAHSLGTRLEGVYF